MGSKIELGPEPTLEDIPIELLECLRDRMKVGRQNYGAFDQWIQRTSRPGYRKKRLRNMVAHLMNIVTENYEEDDEYGNIGGVLFGCMVMLYFHKESKKKNPYEGMSAAFYGEEDLSTNI